MVRNFSFEIGRNKEKKTDDKEWYRCGHCKSLAPEYEKAAAALAEVEVEGGVSLVAVDATEHKEVAERFGVQGFPTLKWVVDGEVSEYGGGRTEADIIAWVTKKTGPAAETIADAAALESFKEKGDVVVLGWFADVESDGAKAFMGAAQSNEEVLFGVSSEASVQTAAGLSGDGVVLFRKFEEPDAPRVDCALEELTKESIATCVAGNMMPLVVPFSQSTASKIFGGDIKQHCLVFLESPEDQPEVLAAVRPVAEKYQGEYLFVSVAKSEARILEFFGITEESIPTARIVEMQEEGMSKFKIPGEGVTEEALEAFVAAHKAGELSQDLKTEEEEEADFAEPVKVLKGTSHDRVALDATKNVLVEYYAPWCGHCKKLVPEYEKLAEHFKDDEDIVIAKMDSTANEVSSVSVQGFPTLKFYPKGVDAADGAIDYDGARDFDGMVKYLDENKV